jgi:plasmid stabilization system protein ParE
MPRSIRHLREIQEHIGRDSPERAADFVARLTTSTRRLESFPHSGEVVEEFGREDLRQILHGNYRIIYRVTHERVEVVAVLHAARLLDEHSLPSGDDA